MSRKLVCLLAVGLLTGCGGGETEQRVPTIPTKGKLFIDNKPFGPVLLNLTINPPNEKIPVVNGYVKADGTFELKTYTDGDGAPDGKYDVRLMFDPTAPAAIPGTKPAMVDIRAPATDGPLEIEIKLESTGATGSPLPQNPRAGAAPGAAGPGGLTKPK